METGKLAYAGDTTAGFTSRSGGTPPATTARSHVSTRSGAGRSEAGMSHLGTGAVAAPLGTFLGTEASDDAKAMWSEYYAKNRRTPEDVELAPHAREFVQRRWGDRRLESNGADAPLPGATGRVK